VPWRLIGLLLFIALIVIFIGFNLENTCDISFGFVVLSRIPIFLTILSSFAAGMIVVLPFAFRKHSKYGSGSVSRTRKSRRTSNSDGFDDADERPNGDD
jgi:uncharacterized integral membrane protein